VPQVVPLAPATSRHEPRAVDAQNAPNDAVDIEFELPSHKKSPNEAIHMSNQNSANISSFQQTPSADLIAMEPSYSEELLSYLSIDDFVYEFTPALEWEHSGYQETMLSEFKNKNPDRLSNTLDSNFDISTELQDYDASFFNFPDDHMLEVPSLTLLNAVMKVAQRLNFAELIWDMTAISPFFQPISSQQPLISLPSLDSLRSTKTSSVTSCQGTDTPNLNELPPHLQPTPTQRLIPHHPILDLLPWPGTRDKLIQVFNLPVAMRPKSAQDPLGLARLVYDMEDPGGEGLNIQGSNPFSPVDWEIGQLVFERWWWAFESSVVESCNNLRRKRGERGLSLTM
jgi:hypothetical protein